jgi:hypothetical protein
VRAPCKGLVEMEKVKLQMGNIGFVKLTKTKILAYYGWYQLAAFVNEMLLEVRIRNGIGNMHVQKRFFN